MTLRALGKLDEVQHLHQLEAFAADGFLAALAAELGELAGGTLLPEAAAPTLEAIGEALDAVRDVLGDIDKFAHKSMGIRMSHALAAAPVPPQLRTLLTATVLSYQHDLPLLRARVGAIVARLDGKTSAEVTENVMAAAESVLSARAQLGAGVLAIAQRIASARLPAVHKSSRARALDAAERQRWARARIDLEQLASAPEGLVAGTFAERLAALPAPPDDPEPEPDVSRFSLLEFD